jgi:hypothetical protein
LFAGTELAVFFSLNDGNSWQPLRLNMAGNVDSRSRDPQRRRRRSAHTGRSFWILDDITPLRQLSET